MILAFVLVPIGTWAGLGFPVDRAAVGLLASDIIAGFLLGLKELLGGKSS